MLRSTCKIPALCVTCETYSDIKTCELQGFNSLSERGFIKYENIYYYPQNRPNANNMSFIFWLASYVFEVCVIGVLRAPLLRHDGVGFGKCHMEVKPLL